MFQSLECRGATIFILAILTVLVLAFIGAATIWKPEVVFDSGMRQNFWTIIAGGLLTGLTTALSGTKRNGNGGTQ
jgi:hypothetical protein